jgi:hypothetical protein
MQPRALRGSVIVIPMDDYSDEDGAWTWQGRQLDGRVLAARLGVSDLPAFAISFDSFSGRLNALLAGAFKGHALRDDVQAFLLAPAERMRKAAAYRRHGAEWSDNYAGNSASLAGLRVDWEAERIMFPERTTAAQRQALKAMLFYKALSQTGSYRQYRLQWLRRIAELARRQDAQVIVIRVPAGPVPRPRRLPHHDSAVMQLHGEGAIAAEPAGLFAPLERPEYFFDALHMNGAGRREFSSRLAAHLAGRGLPRSTR